MYKTSKKYAAFVFYPRPQPTINGAFIYNQLSLLIRIFSTKANAEERPGLLAHTT
jgi:hypothetical protein